MIAIEEFTERFVRLHWHEAEQQYYYSPMNIMVEKDSQVFMCHLMNIQTIRNCYDAAASWLKAGASKLYMAIDIPANQLFEQDSDFIAVFTFDRSSKKSVDLFAIPYDRKTGVMKKKVTEGKFKVLMMLDFLKVLQPPQMKFAYSPYSHN
jgi:hypothetical protein